MPGVPTRKGHTWQRAFEEAEANLTDAGIGFTEILCEVCDQSGPDAYFYGDPVHARCAPGGKVDPW